MNAGATRINWRSVLDDMVGPFIGALLQDREFTDHVFGEAESARRSMTLSSLLDLLLNEAARSMQMIEPLLRPGMRVLEIGGGVGLTYALLRSRGFDTVSLEPGAEGFGDRHRAGLCLMELLGIDSGGWLRSGIEDYKTDRRFDLVFSHFVLEHIPKLDRAFLVMSEILSRGGQMIHRCPNYSVPFEPHFNIPLVPFQQKWTELLIPRLKGNALWQGLQFTTVRKIKRFCVRHGLRADFRRGMTAWAFEQLLSDPSFASRKKVFVKVARGLGGSGLLDAIRHLPSIMDTPMEFTASKTSAKPVPHCH